MNSVGESQTTVRSRSRWAVLLLLAYWSVLVTATHWPQIPFKVPLVWRFDYLLHAGAFLMLGWLLMWAFDSVRPLPHRNGWVVLFTLFFYCIFDESMQIFFPTRDVAWTDAAANIFGSSVGVAGYRFLPVAWRDRLRGKRGSLAEK